MNNAIKQIKKYWKINLITFLVALAIGATIFCLMFFLRSQSLYDAANGASVASVSILFVGLLMWVSHLGAFDTFAFGFKQLGSMFFAKNPRRDGTYADYKQNKADKRAASSYNFVAVILAGLFMLISVGILEIIYHVALNS